MKKVLFICHGNICRSVSAQYIMEDLAKKNGVELYVSSAATSREEIGNDIYFPAKRKLKEKGIPFSRHYARQATMSDYLSYDYLICMDENNVRNLNRMFDNDPDHKIYKLLSRDVSDPWYTNDFETAYNDIYEGCKAWLEKLSWCASSVQLIQLGETPNLVTLGAKRPVSSPWALYREVQC